MVAPDDFADPDLIHPNAPRRGPVYTAFGLVVVCGLLGAVIGSGLADAGCVDEPAFLERLLARIDGFDAAARSCTAATIGVTLVSATIATIGAGVVAVLVMRAMADWRAHPPEPQSGAGPTDD